jgi:hypothetical protein
LDDGTYYVQVTLNGYSHTEETIVVDSDPEAFTLSMTAQVIASPSAANACRIWAYPYDIDGTVDGDTDTPLFKCNLNKTAQKADGAIVEDSIDATRHADGYWYVDATHLDTLVAMDESANSTLTYTWLLRNRRTLTKRVDAADGVTANLIADLD